MTTPSATELIGVYRADGGLIGELRYAVAKVRGTAHCALCDITHGTVRRKPAWDTMVERIGLPFRLLHLNELTVDLALAVAASGSPVVLARRHDGTLEPVLVAAELEGLGGSVTALEAAVVSALSPGP